MNEIEHALERLVSVMSAWAPPVWVSLHFSTPIYKDNCGGMSLEASTEGGDIAQLAFDWDGIDVLTQSALQIRDHLFLSTGKRIWGLTFTLYPDGKYDIACDYNKPEDYQDSDEVASTSSSSPVADLLGGLVDPPSAVADSTFLQQALQSLQTQTAYNSKDWGLGTETQWNLEMDAGILRFTFADGRVLTAPVQVVGTYNTTNGTFLWGWDHPSVPEPLRRAAQRVHDYGEVHSIEAFTTRSTICSESDAWGYAAVAAKLDEAAGAYRGDAGGTWVYMVFAPPVAMD